MEYKTQHELFTISIIEIVKSQIILEFASSIDMPIEEVIKMIKE